MQTPDILTENRHLGALGDRVVRIAATLGLAGVAASVAIAALAGDRLAPLLLLVPAELLVPAHARPRRAVLRHPPAPDARRLVGGGTSLGGGGRGRAAGARAAGRADRRVRDARPLPLDARRGGRRGSPAAGQAGVPQRAVLCPAPGGLFQHLDTPLTLLPVALAGAGRKRRSRADAADGTAQCAGDAAVRAHRDVRRVRPADVARPALVLDDVRRLRLRRQRRVVHRAARRRGVRRPAGGLAARTRSPSSTSTTSASCCSRSPCSGRTSRSRSTC